jgi:hypothetical protein
MSSINKCYVKLLSGDVKELQVFDGYKVSQMKNELIENTFFSISDPNLLMIFNEENKELEDRDVVYFGNIYNLFIKEKPVNFTIKFKKDFTGGNFSLYNENGFVSLCGYDHNLNLITDFENIYIDSLFLEGFYNKAYKKIRNELWRTNSHIDSDDDENYENEYTDYYNMSNEEVLEKFIDFFVKQYCIGIKKIVLM